MRLLALLTALFLYGIVQPTPSPSIIGRWDITFQRPNAATSSGWIEVRHSGTKTLVGSFVGLSGSARPISEVQFTGNEMRFTIPPQWERADGNVAVTARLENERLTGTMAIGSAAPLPFTVVRAPSLRRAAPPQWDKAEPIFNGRDLTGWHAIGTNEWEAAGGILRNRKSGGNLVTDATFTDFKLHVEFRYPADGNSGIYLRGRYEVQVADTGDELAVGSLGAIYGFLEPSDPAAKKPDEWQTFDVTLVGRMVTIVLNGTTIIANREIPGPTGAALDSNEGAPGPLLLQGDHTAIEYRNITIARAR
jgi:3-keto-disaccharide hydrolase